MNLFTKRCIFLTFLVLLTAATATGTELFIPALKAVPGNSVNVPVMIKKVDNLAGMKLVLKYDPEILSYKDGKKSKYTASMMHIVNSKKPGTLIIVMAAARGIKGHDFPLITLMFDVKGSVKKQTDVRFQVTEVQLMSDKLKNLECKITLPPLSITVPVEQGKKGVKEKSGS